MLRIPINHFEGNYTCAPRRWPSFAADDRVVLRYVDNPNGSIDDIAGICNEQRNVVGSHAASRAGERRLLGSTDGVAAAALAARERAGRPRAARRRAGQRWSATPTDAGLLEHLGGDADACATRA